MTMNFTKAIKLRQMLSS